MAPRAAPPSAVRTIEYMRLDDVKPARRNPKLHADADLSASLDRFGVIEPMALDERTGRLVSGHGRHGRILAAAAAGAAPPEGVTVADDGSWLVPVVRGWRSRNDVEASAALIAVNQLIEAGGWNLDMLARSLATVSAAPDGLAGVGYDDRELAALARSLAPGVGDSGVGESINDKAAGYAGSGVRSFVLDYDLATFDRVTRLAVELRRARQVATNSDLAAALIDEACSAAGIRLGDDPKVPADA